MIESLKQSYSTYIPSAELQGLVASLSQEDTSYKTTELRRSENSLLVRPDEQYGFDEESAIEKIQSPEYMDSHLNALTKVMEENLFGFVRAVAANIKDRVLIRELAKEDIVLDDLISSDILSFRDYYFSNLMETLDKAFSLNINAPIKTDNIVFNTDLGFKFIEFGLNDDQVEARKDKKTIVDEIRQEVLAKIANADPEQTEDINNNFELASELFLDDSLEKYKASYQDEAQSFGRNIDQINKKLVKTRVTRAPEFEPELIDTEQSSIAGYGRECLAIKDIDDSKVAKIHHRGNPRSELKALAIAEENSITVVPKALAWKDNVLIETLAPGKSLENLKDSDYDAEKFKKHLESFVSELNKLTALGVEIDTHASNIFYDNDQGFTAIDLNYDPYAERLSDVRKAITGDAPEHLAKLYKLDT